MTAVELADRQVSAEAGHVGRHVLAQSVLIELMRRPYSRDFYVAHEVEFLESRVKGETTLSAIEAWFDTTLIGQRHIR